MIITFKVDSTTLVMWDCWTVDTSIKWNCNL